MALGRTRVGAVGTEEERLRKPKPPLRPDRNGGFTEGRWVESRTLDFTVGIVVFLIRFNRNVAFW